MPHFCRLITLSIAVVAAALCNSSRAAPDCIWLEAEDYARCNFNHFEKSSMGKPELLSGGEWIMRGVGAEEVAKLVPAEGIQLRYEFEVRRGGPRRLWARVGWFAARAAFQWRIDDGPWSKVPADYATTNLMELAFFCEVSWADLGRVDVARGKHALELRYPKVTEAGKRMLVALDCLALVADKFVPEGPFKPGETYDHEADRRAARQVFALPKATGEKRTSVELTGPWQVARYDDPNMDVDTYKPLTGLPSQEEYPLRWMAFEVPGNPWDKPPLVFGHRLIYRTRVHVPGDHAGRAFKLHFSGTNWIVSVFVGGQLAGTHRGVWVPWDLDVSGHVRPGQTNEIAVAVKGTYYAQDPKGLGNQSTLMSMRSRPLGRKDWTRWVAPIYPSTKGDGDGYVYGIVNPVRLVSTGPVYTTDVFVKPSVEKKRLTAEITLRNTTSKAQRVSVACQALDDRSGEVEKAFAPLEVRLAPGQQQTLTVAGDWEDPKLWWPRPNPDLYRLRTTVSLAGKPVDVHEQLFGFREVTVKGTGVYINGVRRNFWNWVDVHPKLIKKPQEWADAFREENNRFMRFSHGRRITAALPSREQRLEFYDRAGIPGRLCTMIDGMFITYNLGQRLRDADGDPLLVPNEPVWENFRQHMAQVAKAYRNHPSVIMYQVENELVYINGMNIYGGYLDQIEELMGRVCEAGRAIDPTRPYTVGGGGDLSGRLEINSPHYPHTAFDHYPENAYTLDHYATKIQRWPWDRSKPWIVGESCFANELAFGAYVAGDEVFRGTQSAKRGKAKWLRMLYGGYRWAGVAGFFPWDNLWQFDDAKKVFSPLCVIPRRQTSRLYGGRNNRLLLKVINDTLSDKPLTLQWSYVIHGTEDPSKPISLENGAWTTVTRDQVNLQIEPGFGKEHTIVIPAADVGKRVEGVLTLKLSQQGAEDYVDRRIVPVLPSAGSLSTGSPLLVFDRQGVLTKYLRARNVRPQTVTDLKRLDGKTGLLIVGPDTLTPAEAYGPELLKFAARGGRVVCLEQETPPAGAALPAPLKTTGRFGGYAHPQALGTPIFEDLGQQDLIDWAAGHPTYKSVYRKPTEGGRSLAECGGALESSPLVEVPCGKGVMYLCQLRVAGNLGVDPAADVLLRNLLSVADAYRPSSGVAAVYCPDDPLLADKVKQTGALVETVDGPAAALDANKYRLLIVRATSASLDRLLKLTDAIDVYTAAGGSIMLCGVEPGGLAALNELVNGQFILRPFRVENVTLENPQHRLAATLGNRDLALRSPQVIMHGRYWMSGNTFSHVIDCNRDFAPFTLPPEAPDDPFVYKPTFDDKDPYNFVNGMLNDASWRYISQLWVPQEGPLELTFRLRRPEKLETIRIFNNENYWTIEDLDVVLDDDRDRPIRITLPDAAEPASVTLPQPRQVQRTIRLIVRTWRQRPISRTELRLVGIDNVQFLRPAPSGGRPIDVDSAPPQGTALDSVGGLVAFRKRQGWIVLNQIKWLDEEPRPENAAKKLRILGVTLANMGVGSRSASRVAVPGVNVRFTPVVIQEHCTGYLDSQRAQTAWFDVKGQEMGKLTRGRSEFADVTYHVVDYGTAPIPDCIILGGDRSPARLQQLPHAVEKIPVGSKADVLYFLHAAHVHRPITDRERQQMLDRSRPFVPPALLTYVLHYADGQTAEVPAVLEQDVDHWIQPQPKPLVAGRIGWSAPLADGSGRRMVVYSMQAANPRPDVEIRAIDVRRTSDRANPAVLAITLGQLLTGNDVPR